MLNEEELTKEGLAGRLSNANKNLISVIEKLKVNMENKEAKCAFKNEQELLVLLQDAFELKEYARRKPSLPISQKVISIWNNNFKPLLKELNSLIIQWNKTHTNKFPRDVKELTGEPIREEKYFDY